MSGLRTVGEIACELSRQLGTEVRPRDVSDVIYRRRVAAERCPILGGRRWIPDDMIREIERELRQLGRIPLQREEATE